MQLPEALLSRSPEQTRDLGRRVGAQAPRGTVIALRGALGAGKTTLVKGIAEALTVPDAVTSPSFTLVSEYEGARADGPIALYHVDLYRLEAPAELPGIGLEDILAAGGLTVIEWAERAAGLLAEPGLRERTVWIELSIREDGSRSVRPNQPKEPAS